MVQKLLLTSDSKNLDTLQYFITTVACSGFFFFFVSQNMSTEEVGGKKMPKSCQRSLWMKSCQRSLWMTPYQTFFHPWNVQPNWYNSKSDNVELILNYRYTSTKLDLPTPVECPGTGENSHPIFCQLALGSTNPPHSTPRHVGVIWGIILHLDTINMKPNKTKHCRLTRDPIGTHHIKDLSRGAHTAVHSHDSDHFAHSSQNDRVGGRPIY